MQTAATAFDPLAATASGSKAVARVRPGWTPAEARNRSDGKGMRRVTLSEDIVTQVQQALFEGRLAPGDFLGTEASFAEDFRVSRVAIRDALRALKTSGVITIRKGAGGGVHVAHGDLHRLTDALAIQISLTRISMADIIDAQYAIVLMSAELAARNALPAQIDELETLLDRAETVDKAHWGDTIHALNLSLARATGNPAVIAQMEGFMQFLKPFYHGLGQSIGVETVVNRYRAMLKAVRRHDAEGALHVMYEHLSRIRARSAYLDHQPERTPAVTKGSSARKR